MPAWSGLFDGFFGETYAIPFNEASQQRMPSLWLSKSKLSNRDVRELLITLIGATAGGAAADSYSRVEPTTVDDERGGLRSMETISVIARNSTSADVTRLNSLLFPTRQNAFVNGGSSPVGDGTRTFEGA